MNDWIVRLLLKLFTYALFVTILTCFLIKNCGDFKFRAFVSNKSVSFLCVQLHDYFLYSCVKSTCVRVNENWKRLGVYAEWIFNDFFWKFKWKRMQRSKLYLTGDGYIDVCELLRNEIFSFSFRNGYECQRTNLGRITCQICIIS